MAVEDGDQWVVVCNDCEVVTSREENMAFFGCPSDCEAFEFDDSVPTFGVGEEARSRLYCFPFPVRAICFCMSTKPIPRVLASVYRCVSFF